MAEQSFANGHCQCGDVRWRASAAPVRMARCHCADCRRASGTGHMSLAFFTEDTVDIDGEVSGFAATADSGNTNTRYFCPRCGSRLFTRNSARPGVVGIAVGSAENSDWFQPGGVVYLRGRPAWDAEPGDTPAFDAMPT